MAKHNAHTHAHQKHKAEQRNASTVTINASPSRKPAALRSAVLNRYVMTLPSNENKMSDGGRGRVSLAVKVWKSSQSGRRAVRRSLHRMVRWIRHIVL